MARAPEADQHAGTVAGEGASGRPSRNAKRLAVELDYRFGPGNGPVGKDDLVLCAVDDRFSDHLNVCCGPERFGDCRPNADCQDPFVLPQHGCSPNSVIVN